MRAIALPLLLASGAAYSEPFTVRDQNPLLAGFGLPTAMPARLSDAGWSFGSDVYWGSNAIVQQRGNEALIVDAETREFRLTVQRALTDRISLQVQLPYRYTGGGTLDGFIDSWHDTFGLPDGARTQLPSDRLNISYRRGGATLVDVTSSATGLGDIQLGAGLSLASSDTSSLTAWLNVELPTGDADDLTGSGATDVSLLLSGQHRLTDRWTVFAQAAVTSLGDSDLFAAQQEDIVYSALAGLSVRAWRGLSLKLQIDAHSAALDSELDFLSDAVVLTLGGDYQFASGWRLDVGVSEDVAVDHSPDVVFLAGLKRGWR